MLGDNHFNTGMFVGSGPFSGDPANNTPIGVSKPLDPSQSEELLNPNTDSEVARRVKESLPYKQAYELFKSESNPIWLQRLEAIPYSVDDAYQTMFDRWHWSNNYEDKQDANYQYCMEQISVLVRDYQTWKNSLPIEQVNQLARVGINSAVTGQGVNPSDIPASSVSTDPSTIQSTNAIGIVSEAANFMLNAVGGFADLASKFSTLRLNSERQKFDMKLQERNFVSEINKYAREHGITFEFFEENGKVRALRSFSDLGKFNLSDPEGRSIELKNLLENSKVMSAYGPLIGYALMSNPNFMYENLDFIYDSGNGEMIQFAGIDIPKSVALDAVTEAQYKIHELTMHIDALNADYQNKFLAYQADTEKSNADKAYYEQHMSKYEKEILSVKNKLIHQLYHSNNPDDKLLLMKILNNVNASDIEILKQAASFAEANSAIGLIRGLIPFTGGNN